MNANKMKDSEVYKNWVSHGNVAEILEINHEILTEPTYLIIEKYNNDTYSLKRIWSNGHTYKISVDIDKKDALTVMTSIASNI